MISFCWVLHSACCFTPPARSPGWSESLAQALPAQSAALLPRLARRLARQLALLGSFEDPGHLPGGYPFRQHRELPRSHSDGDWSIKKLWIFDQSWMNGLVSRWGKNRVYPQNMWPNFDEHDDRPSKLGRNPLWDNPIKPLGMARRCDENGEDFVNKKPQKTLVVSTTPRNSGQLNDTILKTSNTPSKNRGFLLLYSLNLIKHHPTKNGMSPISATRKKPVPASSFSDSSSLSTEVERPEVEKCLLMVWIIGFEWFIMANIIGF